MKHITIGNVVGVILLGLLAFGIFYLVDNIAEMMFL